MKIRNSPGCCGCDNDECIEPPEMQITGLTEASGWHPGAPDWYLANPSFCCWEKRFTYDSWPILPTRFTSPVIQEFNLEFKGRRTSFATIGTISGSYCIDQEEIDVAYIERWRIYEDAWRKYAYVAPAANQVIVKAFLITIMEMGVPVLYWAFGITEEFTATYGYDRKFRNYVDNIQVAIECVNWLGGDDPTYASRPTSSWVEQTPVSSSYVDASVTFGLVKVDDLEALPPGDWLEQGVSTTDENTPSVAGCVPGVQDPFLISYGLDPPPLCSQIEVDSDSCGEEIITTGAVLFDALFLSGKVTSNVLRINSGCCIDPSTVCEYNESTQFWVWRQRAEVITSTCLREYNPVDLIIHSTYTVRFRLP
jgi:hypothetical protein